MFYGQTNVYSNLKCCEFKKMRAILTPGKPGKEPYGNYHQILLYMKRFNFS